MTLPIRDRDADAPYAGDRRRRRGGGTAPVALEIERKLAARFGDLPALTRALGGGTALVGTSGGLPAWRGPGQLALAQDGQTATLCDIALDVLSSAPEQIEPRGKAGRRNRRSSAKAAPVAAVHAVPVDLDPAESGEEALRRIGIACLDQVLRNGSAVLADLPEGIHQMRVGVRRLRAILSAFGKMLPAEQRRWAAAELHWLATALGAARNLDVFVHTLLAPARQALDATDGMAALTAAAEERRILAYAQAKKAVGSRRYAASLVRLLRWFENCGWRSGDPSSELQQPVEVIAADVLDQRMGAAKRRSKGFAGQSARRRHRLRIALKKLRYATELLADLYGPADVEQFVRRVKRLQDDLGDANDLRAARDIVAELAAAGDRTKAIAAAGEAVLAWHAQRLAGRDAETRDHLDRLVAAEPFWTRPGKRRVAS